MKYALNLAEDKRILSATFDKYAPEGAVLADELPEGNIADYLYIDGEYVYDPLSEPEQPETPTDDAVTWDELAVAIREGVNSI